MAQKRVNSTDVARRAGVSRSTVSLVLNHVPDSHIPEETRQRVLQAASELGYVPDAVAQSLVSGRSRIIGLVLSRNSHHIASDAFLTQLIDNLTSQIRQRRMHLLLEIVEEDASLDTYRSLIFSNRMDGVLFSGPRFHDQTLDALQKMNFPTVLIGQIESDVFPSVDIDNQAAAYQAVQHLIQLGHTRIGCITNAPFSYTAATDRRDGYFWALEEAGIIPDNSLVREGEFDPESGYNKTLDLFQVAPHPTALFVASDIVAIGAIAAIRHLGLRIPQDVALVGFDDVPLARYLDPALTTIRLPVAELAANACDVLFNLLDGKFSQPTKIFLPTRLIVRSSCGATNQNR